MWIWQHEQVPGKAFSQTKAAFSMGKRPLRFASISDQLKVWGTFEQFAVLEGHDGGLLVAFRKQDKMKSGFTGCGKAQLASGTIAFCNRARL